MRFHGRNHGKRQGLESGRLTATPAPALALATALAAALAAALTLSISTGRAADEPAGPSETPPLRFKLQSPPSDDATPFARMRATMRDASTKPADAEQTAPAAANAPASDKAPAPDKGAAATKPADDKQPAPAGTDRELKDAAEAAAAAKAASQKAASQKAAAPASRAAKVIALPGVAAEELLKQIEPDDKVTEKATDKNADKAGPRDAPYRSTGEAGGEKSPTPAPVKKPANAAAETTKPADSKPAADSKPQADAKAADAESKTADADKKPASVDSVNENAAKGSDDKKTEEKKIEEKKIDEKKPDDKKASDASKTEATKAADKKSASDSSDAGGSLTDKLLRSREPQRVQPPRLVRMTPALAALRERARRVLAAYFHQPINTVENTSGEVLSYCLAYGAEAEIRSGGAAGNAVNGIGSLCFNYPCGGYQLLKPVDKLPMARMGYGLQSQPGQMLAVLALASVAADYELRLGNLRGHVSDLVEFEKLDCVSGADLSQRLLGLSFYVPDSEKWKNRLGEEWSVERLLTEELDRAPVKNDADVVNHLMAVSFAVRRFARGGNALEGNYRRADDFVARYHTFALSLQNGDGSWHPQFFAMRGGSRDVAGSLRSSGYILHWLASSLSEEKLDDPRVVRAVSYLINTLEEPYGQWNITASSPREIDGVAHALAALRTYDHRVFKPHDAKTPPAERAAQKPAPVDESTE